MPDMLARAERFGHRPEHALGSPSSASVTVQAEPAGTEAAESALTSPGAREASDTAPIEDGDIQLEARASAPNDAIRRAAVEGVRTPATTLPHADRIQEAFGAHDVSQIQAHVGPDASASAAAMGAAAFATGDHVVFAGEPSLHTVAHEAAHVVQQRGGVQLAGGVGQVGDVYERNADAVADRVVAGLSAGDLLDRFGGSAEGGSGQRRPGQVEQLSPARAPETGYRAPSPTEALVQRRIVTTAGDTTGNINTRVNATFNHLNDTAQAVGPAVADRAQKAQRLLAQLNDQTFTYTYASLANILEYNTDDQTMGANLTKPTEARTHVTNRVTNAAAGTLGFTRTGSYSAAGNGADMKHGQVHAQGVLMEPSKRQWDQPFSDWVIELHDAWASHYLNANSKHGDDANLAKLDGYRNQALELAAKLDNPRDDIQNLTDDGHGRINETEQLDVILAKMRNEAVTTLAVPAAATPVVPVFGTLGPGHTGTYVKVTWTLASLAANSSSTLRGQRTFAADSEPEWLTKIKARVQGWDSTKTAWIKGHLLNANLGGPAKTYNLVPLYFLTNDTHSSAVEELLKRRVRAYQQRNQDGNRSPIDPPEIEIKYSIQVADPGTNANLNRIYASWTTTKNDLQTLEGNFATAHGYDAGTNKAAVDPLKADDVYEAIIRKDKDPIKAVALQPTAVPARFGVGGASRLRLNAALRMVTNGTIGHGGNATWQQLVAHVARIENTWKYESLYVTPGLEVYLKEDDGGGWVDLLARSPLQVDNPLNNFQFMDPIMV